MAGEWYFPVAGENEWNPGSWMPGTKNRHGRYHAAIDIYAKRGQAIVAPVAGEVMAIGVETAIGGNWVQIRGDDGITYYFAHMNRPPAVKKGSRVSAQSYLGAVGTTGSAKGTTPHLHFSMKYKGKPVNPISWFKSGRQADPANYTFDYRDPQATVGEDPFFVGEPDQPKPVDPMRDNITQMLDMMSNAVAGGQRASASDDLTALVTEDEEDEEELSLTVDESMVASPGEVGL